MQDDRAGDAGRFARLPALRYRGHCNLSPGPAERSGLRARRGQPDRLPDQVGRRSAALPVQPHAPMQPRRDGPGGRRRHVGRHGLARLHDGRPEHGDRLRRGRASTGTPATPRARATRSTSTPASCRPDQSRRPDRDCNADDCADLQRRRPLPTPTATASSTRRTSSSASPTATTTTATATSTTSRAGTSTTTRTTRRPRLHLRPRQQPDEAGAAQTDNGIERRGICPKCRLLPVKAGAGGARPHRRPRPGLAVRRRCRRRRDRLDDRRPRLLLLHVAGGRLPLEPRRRDGRVLERLRLHRPPGRNVLPARPARQRPGLQLHGLGVVPGAGGPRTR